MNDQPNAVTASQQVTVTDIQMPFTSMVVFMIKWAFASIPAVIIIAAVAAAAVVLTMSAAAVIGVGVLKPWRAPSSASQFQLSERTPNDPSGVAGTGKIYLDYPHMSFHEPGCLDVANIPSAMAYDRDAALASGYKPHTCVTRSP